jgi:hypothetical protein
MSVAAIYINDLDLNQPEIVAALIQYHGLFTAGHPKSFDILDLLRSGVIQAFKTGDDIMYVRTEEVKEFLDEYPNAINIPADEYERMVKSVFERWGIKSPTSQSAIETQGAMNETKSQ